MECTGLQINPSKIEWLWIFRPPGDKILPLLFLDGVALPQTRPVYYLLLGSWLLLKKASSTMASRAFIHLRVVCQLCPFLDWETLLKSFMPLWLVSTIARHSTWGCPWRNLEASTDVARLVMKVVRYSTHIIPLLFELHWLLVWFQVQFKVLLIIFKDLLDLEVG